MRFTALPTRLLAVACLLLFVAAVPAEAQRKKKISRLSAPSSIELSTSETTALAPEAEAANLDQCRNGGVGEPPANCEDIGGPLGWENGNAGGENAHYKENGYIYYRLRFTGLTVGQSYTIDLAYDIYHQDPTKHAIDYLGTYNADSPTDANDGTAEHTIVPCSGFTNADCTNATPTTYPIPTDTVTLPNNGSFQIPGVFTMWGGTITSAVYLPYDGTEERVIRLTFTADEASVLLAWSGHIAWEGNWGVDQTASDINGSPYHMRIKPGIFGGQQDRSLSTSAIITTVPTAAPASVTGRVTDRYGRGISYARVQILNAGTGETRYATTNTFGFYRFDDLVVGDAYTMNATHKRYVFGGTQTFTLSGDFAGADFVAN